MASFLDRQLQKTLLCQLVIVYPKPLSIEFLIRNDEDKALRNLAYLEEHGLVNVDWNGARIDMKPASATITAKGLDFISDDGGLTAEFGVVTVNLHKDTIKELIFALQPK